FDVERFEHHWSAQQYRSADALPYIGRSGHDNTYVGTGYAADGLVWGTVAASIISGLILDQEIHGADDLLRPARFTPVKSAKVWLAQNTKVAEELVKDRLSPVQLNLVELVALGEGKIIETDNERLAVFR